MTITEIENEAHWHALRKEHIGASEIQAIMIGNDELEICSDDSFITQNELYWLKKGVIDGIEASPIMEWGNVMEPLIANMIAAEKSWTVDKATAYHEHPDHPHLGCTLDYYATETEYGQALLQIKNIVHTSHKWTQTKATPYVELQVQHELLVANAAREAAGLEPFAIHCIGSMHKGNPEDLRTFFREPDKTIQDAIIDASARFWSNLEAGVEPDINNPKDYAHILEMLKSSERLEERVDLSHDHEVDDIVLQYQAAKKERLAAKRKEDALKARLMRKIIDVEGDKVVSYVSGYTDEHELVANTHAQHRKATEARTIYVTKFDVKKRKY